METTPQPNQPRPLTWRRLLFFGSFLLFLFATVIAVISHYLGFGAGAVLGVILCLLPFPWLGEKFIGTDWAIGAAWLGLVLGIVFAATDAETHLVYSLLRARSVAQNVPVRYAFTYREPVLYFADGIVRTDLAEATFDSGHTSNRTGGSGRSWAAETRVAPLVWDGWDQNMGVTVWVVCTDHWERDREFNEIKKCTNEWEKPHHGGYAVNASVRFSAEEAIRKAETTHDLRSHAQARMIHWSNDPLADVETNAGLAWGMIIFFELLWMIAVFIKRKTIS